LQRDGKLIKSHQAVLHGAHIVHNLANIAWSMRVEQFCFRSQNILPDLALGEFAMG
jgi:hypothetical protein